MNIFKWYPIITASDNKRRCEKWPKEAFRHSAHPQIHRRGGRYSQWGDLAWRSHVWDWGVLLVQNQPAPTFSSTFKLIDPYNTCIQLRSKHMVYMSAYVASLHECILDLIYDCQWTWIDRNYAKPYHKISGHYIASFVYLTMIHCMGFYSGLLTLVYHCIAATLVRTEPLYYKYMALKCPRCFR